MNSFILTAFWMTALALLADCTIIDMTHPLSATAIYWPGVPGFNRTIVQAGVVGDDNIWIEVGAFSTGEHGGTHIDVPRHFNRSGYDLNDLPIELTVADGVMIDVKDEAARNNDYALTTQKIQEWESQHGAIPNRAAVIVNSGWSSRWPIPEQFYNSNTPKNTTTFHFPIVSKEAAQWLVTNRNLQMLGLDVPGPDGPRDFSFPVHSMLLSRNIIIMENVLVPNTLPARGFRVHAAPIRIVGGTGVQTRIYAMLVNERKNGGSHMKISWLGCILVGFVAVFIPSHFNGMFTLPVIYFHI